MLNNWVDVNYVGIHISCQTLIYTLAENSPPWNQCLNICLLWVDIQSTTVFYRHFAYIDTAKITTVSFAGALSGGKNFRNSWSVRPPWTADKIYRHPKISCSPEPSDITRTSWRFCHVGLERKKTFEKNGMWKIPLIKYTSLFSYDKDWFCKGIFSGKTNIWDADRLPLQNVH